MIFLDDGRLRNVTMVTVGFTPFDTSRLQHQIRSRYLFLAKAFLFFFLPAEQQERQ